MKKNQGGFSLVELLVALAVGVLVVIGAGQLFLATLDTYTKVEKISRKQEAVVFSAHVLVNSYRRGHDIYEMREANGFCEIINDDNEVVIDGLSKNNDACDYFLTEINSGQYEVRLIFDVSDGESEQVVFNVMDRNEFF